jgi:hypothetical protein
MPDGACSCPDEPNPIGTLLDENARLRRLALASRAMIADMLDAIDVDAWTVMHTSALELLSKLDEATALDGKDGG